MKEKEGHAEGKGEGKPHKKHLHQIRTVQAEDGTYVHHHTYKNKKSDMHTEPEREHAATSMNEDEAGQHVTEQMGMNQMGGGEGGEEPGGEAAAGGADQGGGAPAAEMPAQ